MDIYNIVFVQIFSYSFLIYYIWPHFPQKKHFMYLENCMNVKQGLKTEKKNIMSRSFLNDPSFWLFIFSVKLTGLL